MVVNNVNSAGFVDGVDTALDTIGVQLEPSVVCGNCKVEMETNDFKVYRCPVCDMEFIQENS